MAAAVLLLGRLGRPARTESTELADSPYPSDARDPIVVPRAREIQSGRAVATHDLPRWMSRDIAIRPDLPSDGRLAALAAVISWRFSEHIPLDMVGVSDGSSDVSLNQALPDANETAVQARTPDHDLSGRTLAR